MGWSDCGVDDLGRPIGYGHVATCDGEGCEAEIDRGLFHCCGTMHGGEDGCGRYFCARCLDTHYCPDRDEYHARVYG